SFTDDDGWVNARTQQSPVSVNAQARSVSAAGFNLDSVGAKLTYQKPNGTLNVVVNQDNQRTYTADAAFTLDKIRNSLKLNNLKLQFDTSLWASKRVASLHWGQAGVEVDSLDLRNAANNGRIFVNGFVPKQGNANLDIAVDNLNGADQSRVHRRDRIQIPRQSSDRAQHHRRQHADGTRADGLRQLRLESQGSDEHLVQACGNAQSSAAHRTILAPPGTGAGGAGGN